jgi:hypothetical protein
MGEDNFKNNHKIWNWVTETLILVLAEKEIPSLEKKKARK